jgi:2-oxoglutarate dehydrogenase E1 component
LSPDQSQLAAFDSPLSEYSILGFEYGYSLVSPFALIMWEAQFGDFANGAQVIIDNYIVSAQSKWDRASGVVLMLPHGSEGQGPDHSSAHLERFLQLAAQDNVQICNVTTPAQYFHLLRRQVKVSFRKPLIIMTPKSLLRHPKVVSPLSDLAEGAFGEVLDDTVDADKVERVLLCSGKIYYDLLARQEASDKTNAAIVRIEQLYPFAKDSIAGCLAKYGSAKEIVWVQEEPRNSGAWTYMCERFSTEFPDVQLRYHGRDEGASSATGSFKQFQQEQQQLVEGAFE